MKIEEKKSLLTKISDLKKEIMLVKIKASSGESVVVKDYRKKKKEVARLFTQINNEKLKS